MAPGFLAGAISIHRERHTNMEIKTRNDLKNRPDIGFNPPGRTEQSNKRLLAMPLFYESAFSLGPLEQLVGDGPGGTRHRLGIAEIKVLYGFEVIVQLINQRNPRRYIQFCNLIIGNIVQILD